MSDLAEVRVIEEALPLAVFAAASEFLRRSPYGFGWYSNARDPGSFWNINFADSPRSEKKDMTSAVLQVDVLRDVWLSISSHLPEGSRVLRCYSNLMTNSQHGGIHRDSKDPLDLTTLLYMNPMWIADWAGETCFLDEYRDTQKAVLPRPRRAVVFPGDILHVARGIHTFAPDPRVILVFKTTTREIESAA